MNPTALLATGGLDNLCCVWDVRGGVSVARLKGHAGEVTSVEFAGGGAGVGRAAGSESESEGGIAGVGGTGLLLTAGFDATVNVWESRMWRCVVLFGISSIFVVWSNSTSLLIHSPSTAIGIIYP